EEPPAGGEEGSEEGTVEEPTTGGDNEGTVEEPPADGGNGEGGTEEPPATGGEEGSDEGTVEEPTTGGDNEGTVEEPPADGGNGEGGTEEPPATGVEEGSDEGAVEEPTGGDDEGTVEEPPAEGGDGEGSTVEPPVTGGEDEGTDEGEQPSDEDGEGSNEEEPPAPPVYEFEMNTETTISEIIEALIEQGAELVIITDKDGNEVTGVDKLEEGMLINIDGVLIKVVFAKPGVPVYDDEEEAVQVPADKELEDFSKEVGKVKQEAKQSILTKEQATAAYDKAVAELTAEITKVPGGLKLSKETVSSVFGKVSAVAEKLVEFGNKKQAVEFTSDVIVKVASKAEAKFVADFIKELFDGGVLDVEAIDAILAELEKQGVDTAELKALVASFKK
ncbi:hypothetical protein CYJ37_08210, partial [Bacillus sp. UMB0728]